MKKIIMLIFENNKLYKIKKEKYGRKYKEKNSNTFYKNNTT